MVDSHSGLIDDDEPFTVDLDMFELVDSGAANAMSTAVMTNSIPNAGDSQAHDDPNPQRFIVRTKTVGRFTPNKNRFTGKTRNPTRTCSQTHWRN